MSCCTLLYTGVFWCIPVFTGVFWYFLVYTGVSWFIMELAGVFWSLLLYTGVYWCNLVTMRNLTLVCRSAGSTGLTEHYFVQSHRWAQSSHPYWNANSQRFPAISSRFQAIPGYSRLLQAIPGHSGPLYWCLLVYSGVYCIRIRTRAGIYGQIYPFG